MGLGAVLDVRPLGSGQLLGTLPDFITRSASAPSRTTTRSVLEQY
jgi:hypothetical protein